MDILLNYKCQNLKISKKDFQDSQVQVKYFLKLILKDWEGP